MSYGGQQEESYGQEDMEYSQQDQYEEQGTGEEQGHQQQGTGQQQGKGQQKGQPAKKGHNFPHPDVAAQYYAKATAGDSQHQSAGAHQGAMSHTEEMSNQYSQEDEEWGYEEHSNMQMTQGGKGRSLGGNYEDDVHHHAVMQGMEGLYQQGWTEEHKKSAAHIAGYALGWVGKWAGFY